MNGLIASLLKATANKPQGRKVWSIDIETVWIPFFTATNTDKATAIGSDVLGAPLRLAYNTDGSVKFSKSGKPVIRVAKELSDSVKLVRENFVAGLQGYAHTVMTENTEAYKAEIAKAVLAGKPIMANDTAKLTEAMDKAIAEAVAHAEAEARVKAEAEAKLEVELQAVVNPNEAVPA